MPSIGEVARSRGRRQRRRRVVGLGLVVIGALLVGLGTAGAASDAVSDAGLVVGAVAVVVSLAVFATRIGLEEHERALLAVGAVVATASSLFVWALTPTAIVAHTPSTAVAGFGYVVGLAVMLAALLAHVTMDGADGTAGSGSSSVSWTRSARRGTGRTRAADGGTNDDELSFPLEDE